MPHSASTGAPLIGHRQIRYLHFALCRIRLPCESQYGKAAFNLLRWFARNCLNLGKVGQHRDWCIEVHQPERNALRPSRNQVDKQLRASSAEVAAGQDERLRDM